ncbi:cysteine hydrolase [Rhizobium leguminosarum]|jgi:nicotinamidase-related amidase|uniref:Cysteine hydrolase n=2 Tax=Rhizobium TaxID=379 RepID=A0A444IBS5_RHILE|nr:MULTISPECIES: isochorismatase family cysteine hydrolase [Rhizobium]MBY5458994.1 cysteine hydrolase [Rhizobium leguminosarum]NKL61545.1 isochorismatase family protein [Rhizobium leguminosarum bv. viciae]RWX04224.1 cysteine hydrolase [Rhizobium leguminosarum]RWX36553.1 cysteine hydrolase [Rhizobium leguminosarum]TAU45776.1 cysteine hydrolase [Rhizobium leguminosarum]
MSDRGIRTLRQIHAEPYSFPFDGHWSSADTALLLLGFQKGTISALSAMPAFTTALDLLAVARDCGLLVVAARRVARRDGDDVVPAEGSGGWDFPPQLILPDTALVVDHSGDNAFYRTPLETELKARGIRNLLIAGLPTEGLVHATQRTANDMGFECLAVADACQGTSETRHVAQLRITTFGNGLFGTVAAAAAVKAALTKI